MRPRILFIVLSVQVLFAIGLILLGTVARDQRRTFFLETSNRAVEGKASPDDFRLLADFLPKNPNSKSVRGVFGLPLVRAESVTLAREKTETLNGTFWIYYPPNADGEPIDLPAVAAFKGPVQCFVIEFDDKGNTRAATLSVVHPLTKKP